MTGEIHPGPVTGQQRIDVGALAKLKNCEWCGRTWMPSRRSVRTCSPKCRARLRETEKPSRGRPERDYPPEIVEHVCSLYTDAGLTVAEIRAQVKGVRVQTILERYLPERRAAIKRNQFGSANDSWKGDLAGYEAFHVRVYRAFGKPSKCEQCGTTEGKFEWSNRTGAYHDINDYWRLCIPCHRQFDSVRRRETGRRTSPTRR